jgi:tetratricopeptide (TPR) repeat protein
MCSDRVMKTWFRYLLFLVALFLCSADEVTDWLRLGTQFHARGDYATALKWYDKAAFATTDPGLVAYQQAAAHVALHEDEQAATAYQRCLEDALGARRVLALYGQGNALAQSGNKRKGRTAVTILKQAVECYEQSLHGFQQLPAEERRQCPGHEENLSHNLAIVRSVLEIKEKEAESEPPEETFPDKKDPPQDFPDPSPGDKKGSGKDPQNSDGENPRHTNTLSPGKGQLPMLKDDKGAAPLTAEQAQEYLQQTMERLQQQRGSQGGEGMKSGVRDW